MRNTLLVTWLSVPKGQLLRTLIPECIERGFTRAEEHAADIYGEEIVHGIVANPQTSHQGALQLVGESNLSTVDPSRFVEFWTDPAPPLTFRAAFAKHYDPSTIGAQPKYFPKDR